MKPIAELYVQYGAWLRQKLALRFGAGRADDLVQETYLRIASRDAEQIRNPRAFLVTIAVNIARDQNRRARVRGAGNTVRVEDLSESIALSIEASQQHALLLKQVVLAMPELYRDVFVLSRFGGLTYEEIASHCGLNVKTVEWRMSKALAYCAAELEK